MIVDLHANDPPVVKEEEAKQSPEAEPSDASELRWRCWVCTKILKASVRCSECDTALDEFTGEDFTAILV